MSSGREYYAKFGDFQKLFMRFIIEGQKFGDITNTTDAFVLVTVYQSMINGASAMVHAGEGEKEIEVLVTAVKNF